LPVDSREGKAILAAVSPLLVERMKRLTEAPPMIRFLFLDVAPDDGARAALAGQAPYLEEVAARLEGVDEWRAEAIEAVMRELAAERELKPRKAFQPVRAAVTGTLVSPPLFESLEILGRERTLARLRHALD
jgi:glutamyl-tRNA synthetase